MQLLQQSMGDLAALAETGGYTVSPEFYQQLMTIMAAEAFIRPHAFVVPMAGATLQIPYLDVTAVQSAGVSPFFGGLQSSGLPRPRRAASPGNRTLSLRRGCKGRLADAAV